METFMAEKLNNRKKVVATAASLILMLSCSGESEPEKNKGKNRRAKLCKFTNDKPQPLADKNPLRVKVNGRCDNQPKASVAVYPNPNQNKPSIAQVVTGDILKVDCRKAGEPIQDIRGPSSRSDTWLRVKTPGGNEGFIPEVYVGYVKDSQIDKC